MALSHTDTNLTTFKVNKFPSKAAFDSAVAQSLIGQDELSLVEGEENLGDLNDVAISSATDGQVLAYDANTSKWVNANASGGGVIPSDGIRLETVSSSSAFSVNPDVVTVVSGTVGTATITLQVPSDNLAHVWDIIMTTSSSPSITIAASNSAAIKYPMNFYWGASRDVEVSIVGASTKYFVRYGEFA